MVLADWDDSRYSYSIEGITKSYLRMSTERMSTVLCVKGRNNRQGNYWEGDSISSSLYSLITKRLHKKVKKPESSLMWHKDWLPIT
jgi:hypothetical protein